MYAGHVNNVYKDVDLDLDDVFCVLIIIIKKSSDQYPAIQTKQKVTGGKLL